MNQNNLTRGNAKQYAQWRKSHGLEGASEMAVSKALNKGRIRKELDGRIDFEKADAEWMANSDDRALMGKRIARKQAPPVETNSNESLAEATTRRMRAQADQAELDLFERRGELIPLRTVEEKFADLARMTRDRLLALPDELCQELGTMRDSRQIRAVLMKSISGALGSLTLGKGDGLKPPEEAQG